VNSFFGIGTGELMVIIAIAILVIGPKRLLQIAQTLGRLTRRGREIWSEVMKTIQTELQETKEAVVDEIAESGSDLSAEINATEKEASEAIGGIEGRSKAKAVDVQAEVKSIGKETREVMKEVTEGFTSLVMGEEKGKEADEEVAADGSDQPPETQDKESEADKPLGGISG
jgi:sec-independent protein translocase protein TatB